ncbi:GxxExxY protein [Phragmitibacter flavus]|uniref:GxxExxY protein n=1 Tax=Phragmitibacter flavus TaxID=2576071 RepID=A0A5R8KHT5_9BACT|nr:GxxExxY protein [Phragmitibacter flavus]TLD71842.1 GxxExxY protein [Phragmitibacter flavus]
MDTDKHRFNDGEHKELTHLIIGCAFEVLNEMGHGLHEKPYERAMIVELRLKEAAIDQQRKFDLIYKGFTVGEFIPDLIVDNSVVVDTTVIDRITNHERGQMLNYLRITKLRVGLIINFYKPKLEWERVMLTLSYLCLSVSICG